MDEGDLINIHINKGDLIIILGLLCEGDLINHMDTIIILNNHMDKGDPFILVYFSMQA